MGHPQVPTTLKFDNKCAHYILTGVIKQKQSKGMDMRFYCLCDIFTEQKQFHTHWKRNEHNLGYYPTKRHPDKHIEGANSSMMFIWVDFCWIVS